MMPRGRTQNVETQWVGDELTLYDRQSHQAHCLSPLTARTWQLADGSRNVAELVQLLRDRHQIQATEDEVSASLAALSEANLLDVPVGRRDLLRRAAAVGAIGLVGAGTVKTILAPTPAAAQSAPPNGGGGGGDPI